MDGFLQNLTVEQKAKLTSGRGAWHTDGVGGLPQIMMTDGPHGLRRQSDVNSGINDSAKATCFPTSAAIACSWNRKSAKAVGAGIADEAIEQNVSVVLGPGVNVKRSPLCGRNFEYFSEDPFLAGELAASYVNAMQSKGVGSCVKHFAVNSQESFRMTVNAAVDERALREIYLSAFERVIKQSQPYTVMASYNKINGKSATENKYLLTDVLRNEWGFKGLVMSDWGACYDAAESYSAGMDLEMPDGGDYHRQRTVNAVKNGELDVACLDRACQNVVNLVGKCVRRKFDATTDKQNRHELCRQLENDCAVLLKNNGALPLDVSQKVLVVGELACKVRFQGAGSSHINAECKSFLQVLEENGVSYAYAKGYGVLGDKVDAKLQKEAVSLAEQYKTVLFFGGLTDDFEGEGYDRTKLDIPRCQQELLDKLHKTGANVTFVMFGGSPAVMPWLNEVNALLHMYLGGEAVTESAFDLLFGKVSPCGRLAETYPLKLEDTPCYKYFANDPNACEYRESIFVGYRYYNTFNVPVLFPFGYGLSYTKFEYSRLQAETKGDNVEVCVDVKNVGNFDASEVVQIYVDNCDCGYMRAERELRAFEKVFLKAGESKTVNFVLDGRAFSIYIDGFVKVKGRYAVCVCSDVNSVILSKEIDVDGSEVKGTDREKYPSYYKSAECSFDVSQDEFYRLMGKPKQTYKQPERGEYTLRNTFFDMRKNVGLIRLALKYAKRMARKNSPTKRDADPVAKMTYCGALTTPLISLMSVGGVKPNVVMFLYYHANKRYVKALKALFGKYDVE